MRSTDSYHTIWCSSATLLFGIINHHLITYKLLQKCAIILKPFIWNISILYLLNCINPTITKIAFLAPFCDPNAPKKFDFSQISIPMPPILFRGLKMA